MNPHDELLLEAYLDGELAPAQSRRLEAHLAECPECRTFLQQRTALAAVLQHAPAAQSRKSASRFAAEINLRMARQTAPAARTGSSDLVWGLIPAGLLAAMIFLQVALWIATVFEWIPGAGELLVDVPSAAWGADLSAPLEAAVGLLSPFSYWSMSWIAGLVLLLLAALMYIGWLATWWAAAARKNQVN